MRDPKEQLRDILDAIARIERYAVTEREIIKKIKSIEGADLQELARFLQSLKMKKEVWKQKPEALSGVIGVCEGPSDLADKHDSQAY